ncbi:MAG: ParB/RepB/Spo0J family partition protein [Lachnospiraceae bacterium]|nr:ParB/RepB/Spo0J family partition protein [Lachnospiraceae bacterium]
MNHIVNISTDRLWPHPENPRKDLGDLTELAESVRKNGIMQNLTIVPLEMADPDAARQREGKNYTVLIGHRRLAAAKLAGITELPCRIEEGMDKREQVSTMLEENMHRSDLTIYEQAQGFQLMMELGETEASIAEKTGFSKRTIRHRLNIARLDQEELQRKEKDGSFQLSIKDLYELEKVKDIRVRNRILKEASSSRDLVSRAHSAVGEAKREQNARAIGATLEGLGVGKAPEEAKSELYSGKWKTLKGFELEEDVPKEITLPKEEGPMYYLVSYRRLLVLMRMPKGNRSLSPMEQEEKRKAGAGIYGSTLRKLFLDKEEWTCTDEERQEAQKKADALSMLHQMLLILDASMASTNETFDYKLNFNPSKGKALLKGYEALEPYGWYFESEEEKKVLDGTHELYEKEPGKENGSSLDKGRPGV